MRLIQGIIQYWTIRAAPGAKAQTFFAYIVLTLSLLTTVFVALMSSDPHIQQTNVIAALLWIVLIIALRCGSAITSVCHWGTVIALMQIFLRAWFSGGLYASSLVWLPVLVIATYFLLGNTVALVWAAINLLVFGMLAFVPLGFEAVHLRQGLTTEQGVIALVDQSLGLIAITLVMLFYYQFDKRAFADLSARQVQLQTQSERLKQAEATHALLLAYTQEELHGYIQSVSELNDIIAANVTDKPGATMVLENTQQSTKKMLQTLHSLLAQH